MPTSSNTNTLRVSSYFFYQSFLTQPLTIHRTVGERRGIISIPLFHFHSLTKTQTFIYNFTFEMTASIFNHTACIYQTATRWDLLPYCFTIWVNDEGMLIFLLVWWFNSRFFIKAIWHRKRCIWTHIVNHLYITSEPTNQGR